MQTNSNPNQCERILDYLDEKGSITSLEAMSELGIMRLASRISELKKLGYDIDSKFKYTRNRYGEPVKFKSYFMADDTITCSDCISYKTCPDRSRDYPCTRFKKGLKENG